MIEQIDSPKLTQEQRLANHVRRQKAATQKNAIQLAKAKALRERNKIAGRAAKVIAITLEGFGATVVVEHTQAPVKKIESGQPGFGSRNVFKNVWFNEDDDKPHFAGLNDGDETYISAQRASGYTVATVEFPVNDGALHFAPLPKVIVHGKSICSGNEVFNGNVGAFYALMDALHLLTLRSDFESPAKNLFFLCAAMLPVKLESPGHYEEKLVSAIEAHSAQKRASAENNGFLKLKADVGEKIQILSGDLAGQNATVQVIHGHGSVQGFLKLYEPAYEVLTEDGKIQTRLNSEDFARI